MTTSKTTNTTKTSYLTRDAILHLLSDEEVSRVSAMEAGPRLEEGEEYVDLERPQDGVRLVQATTPLKMSEVLPRRAVPDTTWSKICARLAQ
jgi:hypothetical protein